MNDYKRVLEAVAEAHPDFLATVPRTWVKLRTAIEIKIDAEPDHDLRAKRFRFRYLFVPAVLVRSGRRLVLKLAGGYPLFDRFVAALARLRALPLPDG